MATHAMPRNSSLARRTVAASAIGGFAAVGFALFGVTPMASADTSIVVQNGNVTQTTSNSANVANATLGLGLNSSLGKSAKTVSKNSSKVTAIGSNANGNGNDNTTIAGTVKVKVRVNLSAISASPVS